MRLRSWRRSQADREGGGGRRDRRRVVFEMENLQRSPGVETQRQYWREKQDDRSVERAAECSYVIWTTRCLAVRSVVGRKVLLENSEESSRRGDRRFEACAQEEQETAQTGGQNKNDDQAEDRNSRSRRGEGRVCPSKNGKAEWEREDRGLHKEWEMGEEEGGWGRATEADLGCLQRVRHPHYHRYVPRSRPKLQVPGTRYLPSSQRQSTQRSKGG